MSRLRFLIISLSLLLFGGCSSLGQVNLIDGNGIIIDSNYSNGQLNISILSAYNLSEFNITINNLVTNVTNLIVNGSGGGGGSSNLSITLADNTTIKYSGSNIANVTDEYGDNITQITNIFYTGDKITSTVTNTSINSVSTISMTNLTYIGDDLTFVEYS